MGFLGNKMKNPEKKWEHLFTITKKDFIVQTFRSGGKGGQHQNKVETGARIIHKASGAVGESRSEKSQHRNKGLALHHLVASPKFKIWLNETIWELMSGKTIEQKVEKMMKPENLKVEVQNNNGEWVKENF